MTERTYLKPPWMVRTVGARMAAQFNPAISRLSVPGRVTGHWHTVSIGVLNHEGQRYLVAASGDTDWALNLRHSSRGRLEKKRQVEEFTATEVPVGERAPLIKAYQERYGKMPTVAKTFRALPDPAQHPTFLIIPPG